MNLRTHLLLLTVICFQPQVTFAQFADWSHRGTFVLLTTPDGANLPESAYEKDFPVLVRLSADSFNFHHARSDGSDIRFSQDGHSLPYQIEQWDPEHETASLWVRVPVIRGNTRQELTLHWGKQDATSESNGKAVFNESNGFSVVMHLGEADGSVNDEVGSVTPVDKGTTPCEGAIGRARRFNVGKGIACGEDLSTLPEGLGPFTTEAWFRADQVNGTVVGWGNEQGQGKVIMGVRSPPHVRFDCYFSSGNVEGKSRLPMAEWVHVVHAYKEGDTRLYLNGKLDGSSNSKGSPLNIRNPARMWLGGWYNNFQFVGDVDEVRISNVQRSADWVKLCYENQKPNQTLVGTLVKPGSTLTVSPSKVALNEGTQFKVTAEAGGAEKVYWILQQGDEETIVASDRFSYALDAGRVTSETAWKLKFKAVYPDGVKTRDIPVTIQETIPEPVYTLNAPQAWNGRETIEVVPQISNLTAMEAAGAGTLRYRWVVSGGAVIKEIAPDRLVLRCSQCSGPIRVTSYIDNGGAEVVAMVDILVTEPKSDPWVDREPDDDEKPEEGQFYPRDSRNEGTLYYNGTLDKPADAVFLKVYADEKLFHATTQPVRTNKRYAFAVKLKPGLVKYRVEFGTKTGNIEQVEKSIGNLVCGDAYLIDGQSNGLATDTGENAPRETSEWIRSYGGPTGRGDATGWVQSRMDEANQAGLSRPNLWCSPVWKRNAPDQQAEIGWWGMELAKRLVESQKVPVCIIQAAVGGSRIDEHQPAPDNHADLKTMYGRMFWRIQQARLTHGIRAVIWHQGENDQGADGPTGQFGWETYQQFFVDMSAAWKEDMPNIQHYYLFQIWPNACSMGGREGSGDRLREAQRTLPLLYSRMSIISTLGIKPPGGCHFPLEGWGEFARLIQPMIERDLYGVAPRQSISPPNLRSARFTTAEKSEIALEFDQPMVWRDELAREFYLDDQQGAIASGTTSGHVIILKLKAETMAGRITYLRERDWSQDRLVLGANGLAALTFCDVLIAPAADKPR
ncbi:MAG: DUF2341 domain-containing protein [Planctomycetaceae bacterium]